MATDRRTRRGKGDLGQIWAVAPRKAVRLDRPLVLGIVNVTPDSFSDGGLAMTPARAAAQASRMVRDGADGVDVGGESTRPGAARVDEREQIRRVAPAVRAIRRAIGARAVITVDTTRSAVAAAALDAGADAINDVSAGTEDAGMFTLAAERRRGIVLMHRLADPARDSFSDRYGKKGERPTPRYGDVVLTVAEWLAHRAVAAVSAGVRAEGIVLDPGLGFGKTVEQNLELIARTGELAALGYPVMSGLSRKSFIGRAQMAWDVRRASRVHADAPGPAERLEGTVALSVLHVLAGARIVRVHDVGAVVRGLRCAWAAAGGAR